MSGNRPKSRVVPDAPIPLDPALGAPTQKLKTFLELAEQGYVICVCNAPRDREAAIDYVSEQLADRGMGIYRLELTGDDRSIPGRIQELIESIDYLATAADCSSTAISVSSIEATIREDERDLVRRPAAIQGLNQQRDKVRTWGFPIIFWFSEWLAGKLRDIAPDFWSGRSTVIEFPNEAEMMSRAQMELSSGPWNFVSQEEAKHKIRIYEDLARGTTDNARKADFLISIGIIRQQLAEYTEARKQFEQSLRLSEEIDDQAGVAYALDRLGQVCYLQGEYAEAESLDQRALYISEQVFGKDHPLVAVSLNNLAMLYRAQGRLNDAEPLLRRALENTEKTRGKDHPDVADLLNDLAGLYQAQGRLGDAEPLYLRALEIDEKLVGRNPFHFAIRLNNLGLLYTAQGRFGDAEPLFRRAQEMGENALGKDHPNVAGSLNNLALLYQTQGRLSDAEPFFRRALDILRSRLPDDHPDLAKVLTSMAVLYIQLNRKSDARRCLDEANAIWTKRGDAKKRVTFGALARFARAQVKK